MKICTVQVYFLYKVTIYIFKLHEFHYNHVIKYQLEKKDRKYREETETSNFELRYCLVMV